MCVHVPSVASQPAQIDFVAGNILPFFLRGTCWLRLPSFSRPLQLGLICAGMDAPGAFLRANNFPWTAKYFFDVDEKLRAPLMALHGEEAVETFHLGPVRGDICQQDVTAWEFLAIDCINSLFMSFCYVSWCFACSIWQSACGV